MSGPYATYARPGRTQNVAYTATHGRLANATSESIFLVRVRMTTAGFIKIGPSDVVASATADMPIEANVPEYFAIRPGEFVSAVRETSSGTLYVTEMTH